jgi:hypothetical protein
MQTSSTQKHRILDGHHAADPQSGEMHLMFYPGHRGFNACTPTIAILEGGQLFGQATLALRDPLRRVLPTRLTLSLGRA